MIHEQCHLIRGGRWLKQRPVQQQIDGKTGPDLPKKDLWKKKERAGFCEMLALVPQLQAADEEPPFLPTSSICDILG